MAEWPESRQLASMYHSPSPTGIGFAQYASTGTVTPELWENIKYIEGEALRRPEDPAVEGWANDMAALRTALEEEGIEEPLDKEDTQWSRADRAAAALQAHVDETGKDHYGDEGSDEFDEAVISLLTDLKHLLWRAGGPAYELSEMAHKAVDRWTAECQALPEGGDEDDD